MKNQPTLIVRKNVKVKSRQWFLKNVKHVKTILINLLKGKKRNLAKNSLLTILITNNQEIKNLNLKFKKKNKPTDVLSFPLKLQDQTNQKYLGDIIISNQYAKKNAVLKNITIDQEIMTLIVHGYLHLLGYDHIIPKEAKTMFKLQNRVIKALQGK